MNLQAEAVPAAAPLRRFRSIHWNRWSVFLSLTGLAALIPSFFVPAMLVANALEGPRLFSVWTGIRELWRTDHGFLAGLILVFSVIFPVLKLLLSLLCATGRSWLSLRLRRALIFLASWTAKYSMLDVLVVAVLVMTVKVGDYVHVSASTGIYMFCFAIVCSALAGAFLEMGLVREPGSPAPVRNRWKRHLVLFTAGAGLAAWGWKNAQRESGGEVQSIHMAPLTKRGALKRSVEASMELQKLTQKDHDLFSQDTTDRLGKFFQTLATDSGWQMPEAYLQMYRTDGTMTETAHIKNVDFRDDNLQLRFPMPEPIAWNSLERMKLVSKVVYYKDKGLTSTEENVSADADTYSLWTRHWHGRIFTFSIEGPRGGGFVPSLLLTFTALAAAFTGLSGLLAGVVPVPADAQPAPAA